MRTDAWVVLMRRPRTVVCALFAVLPAVAAAQVQPEMREILNRLERLEQQNQELMGEVRALRRQLAAQNPPTASAEPAVSAAAQAPVEERLAVEERRVEEHEQAKVGSEHKLPVTLTGTVLFNAFLNGRASGGQQYPVTAAPTSAPSSGGGSLRQTVLGLKFDGPQIFAGGKVSGSLYLDLYGGTGGPLNQLVRLRVAGVNLDWKNTSLMVGQDKPLIAPREPESLAQVGVSPLTGAGNLWLWQPQVRLEQRFAMGDQAGVRAQVSIFQTSEGGTGIAQEYRDTLAASRPGYQTRLEFWKSSGSRRIEIAPGFHWSDTHLLGTSAPSRIYTVDWLIRPAARFDFTGAFFNGTNVGVLGALRQGVSVFPDHTVRSIASVGGWAQLTYRATRRMSFNIYGGQEDDRDSDLLPGNVSKNLVYAGNVMYRLGTNVITSFEASQTRTNYFGAGTRLNAHYDLALAYLF